MAKTAEKHTLWGFTHLYIPYKGVPPLGGGGMHSNIFLFEVTK